MKITFYLLLIIYILSFINLKAQSYCTTNLYTSGCTEDDYFSSFNFGSINQTGMSCTSDTLGYNDFTSISTTFTQGSTYSISSITAYGSGENLKIWIDYNDDGTFDYTTELLYENSTGFGLFTDNITIPVNAIIGTHRMRVRLVWFETDFDACQNEAYGCVNDYTVTIQAPLPCIGTPNPGNTLSSLSSVCPGDNLTLSLQNNFSSSGITYQWQSSPDNNIWTNIPDDINATLTTSQTVSTYYRCSVTCSTGLNTGFSNPIYVIMNAPTACYCIPTASDYACDYMWITNVTTSGGTSDFNNTSDCAASSYTDYSGTYIASNTQLKNTTMSFTSFAYPMAFSVWIDFNDNGIFEPSEQVIIDNNIGEALTVTDSFMIPITALPGTHLMRVRGEYNFYGAPTDPCQQLVYGETEDYAFTVIAAPICNTPANQPTDLILNPWITTIAGSFKASTGSPGADHYLIVRSTASILSADPINGTSYNANNLLGGGTIVAYQTDTAFLDTSLTSNKQYYYFIFAANSNCNGGPLYLAIAPLTGSATTLLPLTITGNSSSCSNQTDTYYTNNNGSNFSYQWAINGGIIISGANTDSVTVKWNNNCTIGWLTVTETNITTSYSSTSLQDTITIYPLPTPSISGNLNVSLGSIETYFINNTGSNLYSWSITGGIIVNGQGTDTIHVDWACDSCSSNIIGTITVTETSEYGCSGTSSINVTINKGTYILSGIVTYDDSNSIPLNGVTIQLLKGSTLIATTTTSTNVYSGINDTIYSAGYYQFDSLASGTYSLKASSTGTWGGVNATDALLIKLNFVHIISLNALPLLAGDVNLSGTVNSTDALLIQLRNIGLINTFAAGDWVFGNSDINTSTNSINVNGNTTFNLTALCTGDVNRSYIPQTGAKTQIYTNLQKQGTINVNSGQEIEVPIFINDALSLGAVTLDLSYNTSLVDVIEVTSNLDGLNYNIINDKIFVDWSDVDPAQLQVNDVLLTLKVKVKDAISSSDNIFSYSDNTEFADGNGNVVHFSTLKVNAIQTNDNNYSINVYPNPFKNNAVINYSLIEQGNVKLSLYNVVGQRINVLIDENMNAGTYKLNLNTLDLLSGIYFIEIIVNGETSKFNKVIKLVKTN